MKPIIKHTPVTYFFNITCLFAIWRRYYNILHTFKNHIHLNPWKVVRYCKLESKKWRYVLIRCVGRCLLIGGFSRDTHGAPGTYTGVIRPFRLGWSCKSDGPSWIWTAMVACRGAQKILCLRNTSCIIMLHQFTRLMTCIYTRVYVSYVYIHTYINKYIYIYIYICSIYSIYIYAYLKLHTWNSPDFWLNSWLTVLSPRYDGFYIGIAWQWTCHNLIENCFVRGCTNPFVMQWWSLIRYKCPSEITRYQLYTFTWGETTQLLLLRAQKIV